MSLFTKLPQDMLQHEINRFLDCTSRVSFNAVLKPDERVYKKLKPNYAIKHSIKTTYAEHERLCLEINFRLDNLHGSVYRQWRHADLAEKKLNSLFALWMKPLSATAIMYTQGLKEKIVALIEKWTVYDDDNQFLHVLDGAGSLMRANAAAALKHVQAIPFVHTVSLL